VRFVINKNLRTIEDIEREASEKKRGKDNGPDCDVLERGGSLSYSEEKVADKGTRSRRHAESQIFRVSEEGKRQDASYLPRSTAGEKGRLFPPSS